MAIFDSRDDAIEAVRGALTHILELRGATVTAVSWADEAREVVQRERPGVLVSDIAMPGKGGYWLIGQVRAVRGARWGDPGGRPHRVHGSRAPRQSPVVALLAQKE